MEKFVELPLIALAPDKEKWRTSNIIRVKYLCTALYAMVDNVLVRPTNESTSADNVPART